MGFGAGRGKPPLAISEMRSETSAETNRASYIVTAFIAAAVLALLAAMGWPDVSSVAILATLSAALVIVGVILHYRSPDVESQANQARTIPRDPKSGERD
jgi:predicted lysophospholipase L1 biosynthesis ABC-type transport system permease subunit